MHQGIQIHFQKALLGFLSYRLCSSLQGKLFYILIPIAIVTDLVETDSSIQDPKINHAALFQFAIGI